MDDESGESMELMEEVSLEELGESELERLVRDWRREAGSHCVLSTDYDTFQFFAGRRMQLVVDSSGKVGDGRAAVWLFHDLQSLVESAVFLAQLIQLWRELALCRRERVHAVLKNLRVSRIKLTLTTNATSPRLTGSFQCAWETIQDAEQSPTFTHRAVPLSASVLQISSTVKTNKMVATATYLEALKTSAFSSPACWRIKYI